MQAIEVVVGAQFGSEGKGHVTQQLVKRAMLSAGDDGIIDQVINVRVAGPNAGHTVYDASGNKFAFRSVPVGMVEPGCVGYIAPGSEVDMEVLRSEVQQVKDAGHDIAGRLFISLEATLLEAEHKEREAVEGLTAKVGSTGKGIGACRADRIMRTAKRIKDDVAVMTELETMGVGFIEPVGLYAHDQHAASLNQHIIIEGTQGYGLGLHAGHYPQCTSSDARAIDFLAMAGVSPWRLGGLGITVWVVARVYPIRVAGNSGALKGETTWEDLGLEPEQTTVTHKTRRVGEWDPALIEAAVQANGGQDNVRVALTMVDQKVPEVYGLDAEAIGKIEPEVEHRFHALLGEVVRDAKCAIGMITNSPTNAVFIEMVDGSDPETDYSAEAIRLEGDQS